MPAVICKRGVMQRFCLDIFRGGGEGEGKGFQPTLVDMIMTYNLRTHVFCKFVRVLSVGCSKRDLYKSGFSF